MHNYLAIIGVLVIDAPFTPPVLVLVVFHGFGFAWISLDSMGRRVFFMQDHAHYYFLGHTPRSSYGAAAVVVWW